MRALPAEVTVFPDLAAAASRCRERHIFAAWSLLRVAAGGDALQIDDAVGLLVSARRITPSWARRTLRLGEGRYWNREVGRRGQSREQVRIRPVSTGNLALALDTEILGSARKAPIEMLRSRGDLTRLIYAAAAHPLPRADGTSRATPLTRRQKGALTGLDPRHQRRLDANEATTLIEPTYAFVGDLPTTEGGQFRDRGGRGRRRLGDRRVDTTTHRAPRFTNSNARRDLARRVRTDTATTKRMEVPRLQRTFRAKTLPEALERLRRSGAGRGIIEYLEGGRRQTMLVARDADVLDLERRIHPKRPENPTSARRAKGDEIGRPDSDQARSKRPVNRSSGERP